jgi:hypothetical protein
MASGRVRGLFEVIQSSSKSERRLTAEELEYQAHITQTITQNAASCLFMMDHKGTLLVVVAGATIGRTFGLHTDAVYNDNACVKASRRS